MSDLRGYDNNREQRLAGKIEAYWAERGRAASVKTTAGVFNQKTSILTTITTSNIINGWPQ
ncbi:MAG: hypothetical protein COB36_11545 [Alphaproteobacteria bacterium]|nr:MAG: hypothetical protein COB36_11545 [Alphaproteobacteria bacterium]